MFLEGTSAHGELSGSQKVSQQVISDNVLLIVSARTESVLPSGNKIPREMEGAALFSNVKASDKKERIDLVL